MSEREDIEMLLPWYATGKLSDEDRGRAAAYLAQNAGFEKQLALIAEDRDAAISANEALGTPSPGALERLLVQINQEKPQIRHVLSQAQATGVFGWLAQAFRVPALRAAGMAGAFIILLQAAVIGTLMLSGVERAGFETASGPQETSPAGTRLLIAFQPDAKAGDITALLEKIDARIVSGPRAQGLYIIRLQGDAAAAQNTDRIIARLKQATSIVRFVAVAE